MIHVDLGTIVGFNGNHFSGLATLAINRDRTGIALIPCENAPTVRALDAAFGDVIGPGHTFDSSKVIGRRVYYSVDDFGVLAAFTPEDEASEELLDLYAKNQKKRRSR